MINDRDPYLMNPPSPIELLQKLIRFDTTNPPGNEEACVHYISSLLEGAGIPAVIVARQPGRSNLIARLTGRGQAPPLLLYGHVDVVMTEGQQWRYPPFEGIVADDSVWGRGALDMKGGVSMMVSAILRAKYEGLLPAGDIVLAILADEEAGGDNGAGYLVSEYPEWFKGIRFAIGEVGAATTYLGGKKFYPIQIAEKQICWLQATVKGPGGHGSRPMRGGAMAKMAQFLLDLDQARLPVHITPVAQMMIEAIISELDSKDKLHFQQLLDPQRADVALEQMGVAGRFLEPLLRNTVNATIVQGGQKVNVVPSEIHLQLDGRLLPGFKPADLIEELQAIIGPDVELKVLRHDPSPVVSDMEMFDLLADILRRADHGAIPIPMLLAGVTDGRLFSKLGIQTYGFTPMKLPEGFDYGELIHAADERVPVEAITFGSEAIFALFKRYGQ
ncbi:MAG TPA: M20/M25/M40 family metallo-hydrolase [Patescibacteria group bacterium]|nr:M20/M25/M40 family metallo-hydrolase [Patescibacteria group bacterium]